MPRMRSTLSFLECSVILDLTLLAKASASDIGPAPLTLQKAGGVARDLKLVLTEHLTDAVLTHTGHRGYIRRSRPGMRLYIQPHFAVIIIHDVLAVLAMILADALEDHNTAAFLASSRNVVIGLTKYATYRVQS